METKLSLTVLASALALTVALPVFQAVAPVTGSSSAFARQGADDKAGHDANDDKGGRRGGHGADDKGGRRGGHGADDRASHHSSDDKGGKSGSRR